MSGRISSEKEVFVDVGGSQSVPPPPLPLSNKIILNVGGERHEVLWRTLQRFPHTRLGKLQACRTPAAILELADGYSPLENEYFFDRNPQCFLSILDLYRTGKLHFVEDIDSDMCVGTLSQELEYWGIDEQLDLDQDLGECCQEVYLQTKEEEHENSGSGSRQIQSEGEFHADTCSKYKTLIWNLLEKPSSSYPAKILAIISTMFTILSMITISLLTSPDFQEYECVSENTTLCDPYFQDQDQNQNQNNSDIHQSLILMENRDLALIEEICLIFFTLEYIICLLASPNKRKFLQSGLNVIDLLTILMYFISHIFVVDRRKNNQDHYSFLDMRRIFLVFRVLRILRTFQTWGFRSSTPILLTLNKSYKELRFLLVFMAMGIVIFSTLVFYAEKEDNPSFSSIPETFWWAMVTMTTVGYGDTSPLTSVGKYIGSLCALAGVLFMALPIPTLVYNFGEFYKKEVRRGKILERVNVKVKRHMSTAPANRTSALKVNYWYNYLQNILSKWSYTRSEQPSQTQEEEAGRWAKCKKQLWNFMENPESGFPAKVIAIISTLFTLLSITVIILHTVPSLLEYECTSENTTICKSALENPVQLIEEHSYLHEDIQTVENHYLLWIEEICILSLILEYILRLAFSPNKFKFLKAPLNILDLVSVLHCLPKFRFWGWAILGQRFYDPYEDRRRMFMVYRVVRLLRIFQLSIFQQHSKPIFYTLRKSFKELRFLLVFVVMGMMIFSTLAFYAERRETPSFESIPVTFWWAIVTMTTAGYGDMYPVTYVGKLIGSVCCLSGVMVLALPIPILVHHFGEFKATEKRDRKERNSNLKRARASRKRLTAVSQVDINVDVETGNTDTNRENCFRNIFSKSRGRGENCKKNTGSAVELRRLTSADAENSQTNPNNASAETS